MASQQRPGHPERAAGPPASLQLRVPLTTGARAAARDETRPAFELKTRPQLSTPIALGSPISDVILYEDAANPAQKYYLPRYRLAEALVSGTPQYRMALTARAATWALSVVFEKFPAPELGLDEGRTASELVHDPHIVLTHNIFMQGSAAGIRERPFAEFRALPSGVEATVVLATLEERDELYRALTEAAYATNIEVRRTVRAAVLAAPDLPGHGLGLPPPGVVTTAYTVSDGSVVLRPEDAFDLVAGVVDAARGHVQWTADRQLVPRPPSMLAAVGRVPLEPLGIIQLKALAYSPESRRRETAFGSDAVVFVTPHWNPPGQAGVYLSRALGVWFTGSQWSIFNQDMATMPENAAFVVEAAAPGAGGAFVHRADARNISDNWTVLDHPTLNGDPHALCHVTPNWNPGGGAGVYNARHIGVFYFNGLWAIFNQDLSAMTPGLAFNVRRMAGGERSFVHRVTPANTGGHVTTIRHPLLDGRADQLLLLTPNWNPGGTGGVYNNHPTGVYYTGAHWAIFNQDFAAMPTGAAFNVEIVEPPQASVHVARAGTNVANHTLLTLPGRGDLGDGSVLAVRLADEDAHFAKAQVLAVQSDLSLRWTTYSQTPRYREVTTRLDLTDLRDSFVFPPNLYGYIFRGIEDVGHGTPGVVRHSAAWQGTQHPYYQDGTTRQVFYYLPDAFKIARKNAPRRTPELSVRVGSPDGSLERTVASVSYVAVAVTDPRRLEAARESLRSLVPADAGVPKLEPLRPTNLTFTLGLPRAGGSTVSFVEQRDALVTMTTVRHSIELPIEAFQMVFEALFSASGLMFQGQVDAMIGPGEAMPPVPFVARIDDLAGAPITCVVDTGGATLTATLRNVIESPVRVQAITVTLIRGTEAIPADVVDAVTPLEVAAGQAVSFTLRPTAPLGSPAGVEARVDLQGVEVIADRAAVWNSVIETTAAPEYVRQVRVTTVAEMFQGAEPRVSLIRVNLKRGDGPTAVADLSAARLEQLAPLRAPLRDYILGIVDPGQFQYQVISVRGGMRTTSAWKTETADLIITSEDLAAG